MKIIGDLFRELSFTVDEKDVANETLHCTAQLVPNKECSILKAHFPNRPVVPGACLLATVSELICRMLQQCCRIDYVRNIKFTSLIEPDNDEPVTFDIDMDVSSMKVKATIMYKESICCKMSLSCNIVS